jgi:hypothetical protein
MSIANFEIPSTEQVIVDGYIIDLSTGIANGQTLVYNSATHTLRSAPNFFFNPTDGYLGIKTTSPAYPLHVVGDGYFTGLMTSFSGAAFGSSPGFTINSSGTVTSTLNANGGVQTNSIQRWAGADVNFYTANSSFTIFIGAAANTLSLGSGSVVPAADNTQQFGSSSFRWHDGYFGGQIVLDGYRIDLSAGAVTNQVLTYDGTKFAAANSSGGISGTLTNTKVPYATGASTLADSGMAWDNTNKILTVTTIAGNDGVAVTDGYRSLGLFVNYNSGAVGALGTTSNHPLVFFTNNAAAQMTLSTSGNFGIGFSPTYKLDVNGDIHSSNSLLLDESAADVSPVGMGGIRFNTDNEHLEISENGGDWAVINSSNANVKEFLLDDTVPLDIVTYSPPANSNYILYVYYRVESATTNLTLTLTWDDVGGSQTQNIIASATPTAVGSYAVAPLYFNSDASTITLTGTASIANNAFFSASIVGLG